MMETEERVVTNLSRYIEEQCAMLQSNIDTACGQLHERLSKLEELSSSRNLRTKVIEASMIQSPAGTLDPSKMEKALNTWLERVEDQVNSIEELVASKVTHPELD